MTDPWTRWAIAARDGDRAAAEAFFRATQPQVWRFVANLTSPEHADDLTQETFLRALRALPAFRGASSARTWLLSIARRVAADELRGRARARGHAESLAARDDPAEPVSPDIADEVDLRHLLGHLTPDQREAFVLTQVLGLTYLETAGICDCAVGTIRSRVARARHDLIRHLRGTSRDDQPNFGAQDGPS
jgi:RNA polymerase sigma-70 factor, ECF subfamily